MSFRTKRRLQRRLPVRFSDGVLAFTDDISAGGFKVTTGFPSAAGHALSGTVSLASGRKAFFKGKVAWTLPASDGRTHMGVALAEVESPWAEAVAGYEAREAA